MAFNAKNLHYEKQEPAFLRRLRGEHSSDKQDFSVPRPRKARLETSAEDDGPTIIGEAGENVTAEEYQAMIDGRGREENISSTEAPSHSSLKGKETPEGGADNTDQEVKGLSTASRKPLVETSIGQKRKNQSKIIGGDVEPESEAGDQRPELIEKKTTSKPRKGKKVKLSFNEDDG